MGSNYRNRMAYEVDLVFCIDATMSMDPILDKVKKNALNFYQDFQNIMSEKGKKVSQLRIRVVAFRDYTYDRDKAMMVTNFFKLPEMAKDFETCIKSIYPEGGGDDPSFYEDYKDKIKMKTQNGKSAVVQDWIGDSYFAVEMLNEYLGGGLDRISKLSNGDTITFSWNCEDDVIKELFNCKLKCSDIIVQVSGLEEIRTFDPFQSVDIVFEGILPKVGVSITNNSGDEKIKDIQFSPIINPILKTGENIVIQATIKGTEEDFIEKYGMLPSPTEKQFKVDGLPEYIFSHDQMTAEHMDMLFEIAYDELVSELWNSTETIEKVQLIGSYIFSQKEPRYGDYEDYGSICTILYVTVNCRIDTSEGVIDYPVNYYYCIKFDNILLDTDGSIATSNEFSAYSRPYNRFGVDTGYGSKYQYYYYGYQTMEEIKEDMVNDYYNSDDYNFEENKI